MTKEQFDSLEVGDKVCNSTMAQMWGYVEDVDQQNNTLEFDIEEEFVFNGTIVQKGSEIRTHYYFITLLEKAPQGTVMPVMVKVALVQWQTTLQEMQKEIENILKNVK